MRKKLIIILKSNTGKARRKKAFKVFGPTKRIRRKEFVKQLFYLTKPFDYPLILIKVFIGIGQELKVLHKSLLLILTLSQQFSLLRVIENSLMGIVDSQERRLTKGG